MPLAGWSSVKCEGCGIGKTDFVPALCRACIDKSNRTSHRLDGHTRTSIDGCAACAPDAMTVEEVRYRLGLD